MSDRNAMLVDARLRVVKRQRTDDGGHWEFSIGPSGAHWKQWIAPKIWRHISKGFLKNGPLIRIKTPGSNLKQKAARRLYRQANKGLIAAHASKRKALKLQATPAWANHDAIKAIYREAEMVSRRTRTPHHVDHIVPLKGANVCGLHVEYNLQILPAAENVKKSNKHA
jgi:hypothetical protein